MFERLLGRQKTAPQTAGERCARRALKWVHRHTARGEGVLNTSRHSTAYPEVSGYFIPTLLAFGEKKLARQYARWLVRIQNADGSWNGPDATGKPYTFDVGQVLKGLVAIHGTMPEVEAALLRGCDWLASRVGPDGAISTPARDAHELPDGSFVPDAFHLYAMQPLRSAAERFARTNYEDAAARALAHYKQDLSLGEFNTLSHFHAYIVEALLDLGETAIASRAMARMAALQRPDGSIPAFPEGDARGRGVCSTGLAQYALIWLKLGETESGRRAFGWLCENQNKSGGFFGSYGPNADYFPQAEISWAVKYFLDVWQRLRQSP
jgi:malonyl-CoA O-methyltransferase